jgi:hypothetical protein
VKSNTFEPLHLDNDSHQENQAEALIQLEDEINPDVNHWRISLKRAVAVAGFYRFAAKRDLPEGASHNWLA